MRVTLEKFEMSKLGPLKERLAQQHYALNVSRHENEIVKFHC